MVRGLEKLKATLGMIKIEHTIFALPFAFLGALMAARRLPNAQQAGWILLAMAGARSAAMAFNRLLALPYTGLTPVPAPRVPPGPPLHHVLGFVFVGVFWRFFSFAAYMLN